jgi:Na+/H+ antiporter NhaD/arsenite permease-like protein
MFAERPFDISVFAVALACAGSLLVVANLIRRHLRSQGRS